MRDSAAQATAPALRWQKGNSVNLQVATFGYLILVAISTLVLISLGLAVIFGLMGVINLAHGEFMMLGAYTCVYVVGSGLPLWLGFLAAMAVTAILGVVVERVIIRHLYGRLIDTLLATWGLSLFLMGAATTVFGPRSYSIVTNFGNISVGATSLNSYNLVLSAVTFAALAGTWILLRFTNFGLRVRGTMQNAAMASALGVSRNGIYTLTFGLGAALAGLAGAVLAPLTGVSPQLGAAFVTKAFITVITGGHLPLLGTIITSSVFGTVDGVLGYISSSVVGEVGVLMLAVVILRLLPQGITARLRRGI